MQINHCLILAAGFGTRMGDIGQKLPKVLWPVFEKSLLELQVAYAKQLGVQKIYVNIHYFADEIIEKCKKLPAFDDVEFLIEKPEILDIGGGIHNLASKVAYKGKLLVLNADQFFYLSKDALLKFLAPHAKAPVVLFTYAVNTSSGYNGLDVGIDRLVKGIMQNVELPKNSLVETYTGNSLVDLGQLDKIPGPSKFFDSVSNFEKKAIPAILLDKIDYWDFGTLNRYWETMFRILDVYRVQSNHPFLRFLVQERALKTWKIDLIKVAYHAKSPRVINLNMEPEVRELAPTIILSGAALKSSEKPTVWWNGISAELP
jgi:GTP:adenosylcobinamide-phosphate guanylyltransferase